MRTNHGKTVKLFYTTLTSVDLAQFMILISGMGGIIELYCVSFGVVGCCNGAG